MSTLNMVVAVCLALFVATTLAQAVKRHVVHAWEIGLLYQEGRFVRALPPGGHRLFDLRNRYEVVRVPTAEQATQIGPVEAFTRDGFACRLTLSLTYMIADPHAYHEATAGLAAFGAVRPPGFDDAFGAAATAAAARRSLADLLAEPQTIGPELLAELAPRAPGLTLSSAIVSRVQLPPETRKLLGEVEATRLQGQAALERARAEQAALRARANAARLLRDNPELAQLRLLQTVENARHPATIILGQPATPPIHQTAKG